MPIALFSLTDKKGSEEIAAVLEEYGWMILSTGGTATHLRNNNIKVVEISEYTGMPEGMDGRIKTLHPKICGGVLGDPNNPGHAAYMLEHHIDAISMVVVNLYAFEEAAAQFTSPDDLPKVIEKIDIGGPTLIRAAAKNFESVTVIVDPNDYNLVRAEMSAGVGVSRRTRFRLAGEVFKRTATYDAAIAKYMESQTI